MALKFTLDGYALNGRALHTEVGNIHVLGSDESLFYGALLRSGV